MDKIDRQILTLLQKDCSLSTAEIAEQVRLSVTPCWRRIQKLENEGVIQKRVALIDRHKVNLGVDVFVMIKTGSHNADWLEHFSETIDDFDEVVEFYRMSGETDYLLRVVVPDIPAYDRFYKRLIAISGLSDVSSSFAMEQIKYTTEFPLQG